MCSQWQTTWDGRDPNVRIEGTHPLSGKLGVGRGPCTLPVPAIPYPVGWQANAEQPSWLALLEAA